MLRALQNMLFSLVGILFCWFPLLVAVYDAMRGDRGSLFECLAREWGRWWDVYLALRA